MKRSSSPGILLSVVKRIHFRQLKSRRHGICIIFAGLAVLVVLLRAVQSLPTNTWLRVFAYGKTTRDHAEKSWNNTRTTRTAAWEIQRAVQDEDQNWRGREKMRQQRENGSLWWDETAEQYFISKLEESQFPANCSQAHWIAHYDFTYGLLSDLHVLLLPLFIAMVRGHTLVPISEPKSQSAFLGCGPNMADRNIQCYFNVTSCNPGEDPSRLSQVMAMSHDNQRTTWDEVLMEDDSFFSQGGVTVIQTIKLPPWVTQVRVNSSSFSSYLEAYTYHKLSLWDAMGQHGKVGVVTGSANSTTQNSSGEGEVETSRRIDMVTTSLMSSWMLNRMPNYVKHVADEIMSRYVDTLGQPLWKSPVLAIHIRQTDKKGEDPYYTTHNKKYRPIEDYALHMKQIEEEYGFQWPSIFLISDSGKAMKSLMTVLDGNDLATPQEDMKRYIMYDWIAAKDRWVGVEHDYVPKSLKHDMQTHFLATLYIVQKIADNAIVTYSSNVGRFIGEIISAKHRQAFVGREGPLVASLDYSWYWMRDR